MTANQSSDRFIASASITINAPVVRVWDALLNPNTIKIYMFGTSVITDWTEGGAIVWKGEWQGQAYEDKGTILQIEKGRLLQYTHFSPLSGQPDLPENYHTVTIKLTDEGAQTIVSLMQDNNPTEEARYHAEENWSSMLQALKRLLEA